ncbi:hypothetical protein JCM8097_001434 [Rhodosporidiobolus ruineniae]
MAQTLTFPRDAPANAPRALVTLPLGENERVWTLEMRNEPDNRLLPEFIKTSLLPALDYIELSWLRLSKSGANRDGALVLVGERGKGKFFSNGLQLECLQEYPTFFKSPAHPLTLSPPAQPEQDYYYPLLARLLAFPLATVAAINGHCFAGGLCLALCCDWRVCRSDRTWLSMNELQFGAPIPGGMALVLQSRLSPLVVRDVLLTAHRYTAPEALKVGIVDEVVEGEGSERALERAVECARERRGLASTGVLASMKRTLYAPVIERLMLGEPGMALGGAQEEAKQRLEILLKADAMAKL